MTDKKAKPETKELSDTDLDKVQGAGAKGLTGDKVGLPQSEGIIPATFETVQVKGSGSKKMGNFEIQK